MSKCIKICITDQEDDEVTEPLSPEEMNEILRELFTVFLKVTGALTVETEKPEESENVRET